MKKYVIVFCLAIGLVSSSQQISAEEPAPLPDGVDLLLVTQKTALFEHDGEKFSPIMDLPAKSIVRTTDQKKISSLPHFKYVIVLEQGPKVRTGWIHCSHTFNVTLQACQVLAAKANTPLTRLTRGLGYDLPALIQLLPKEEHQLWRRLETVIEAGKPLNQELPELHLAKAAFWVRVKHPDSALREYFRAVDMLSRDSKNIAKFSKYFLLLHPALVALIQQPSDISRNRTGWGSYRRGYHAFWSRDYETARRYFDDATQLAPSEALYWYYLGVTHKVLNQDRRAFHDVRMGAHLEQSESAEIRRLNGIDAELERLQGPLRNWLTGHRTGEHQYRAPDKLKVPEKIIAPPKLDVVVRSNANLPKALRTQPVQFQDAWRAIEKLIQQGARMEVHVPETYYARAEILMEAMDYENALRNYLEGWRLALGRRDANTKPSLVTDAKRFRLLRGLLDRLDQVPRPPVYNKADDYFGKGIGAFWGRRYDLALGHFNDAIRIRVNDPLFWYYRGLAFRYLGKAREADRDAQTGRLLEKAYDGQIERVTGLLERIQGPDRVWLNTYRREPRPNR